MSEIIKPGKVVHNLLHNCWGNAIYVNDINKISFDTESETSYRLSGLKTPIPKNGDLFVIPCENPDNGVKAYAIMILFNVEPTYNPHDMFFANTRCIDAIVNEDTSVDAFDEYEPPNFGYKKVDEKLVRVVLEQ